MKEKTPKHRAWVVGGEKSFVKETFIPHLEEHGIAVDWHLDWNSRSTPKRVPKGCTLVLCIKDMMGHRHRDKAHAAAKTAEVPVYDIQRKWCHAAQVLKDAGVIDCTHVSHPNTEPDMPGQFVDSIEKIRTYVASLEGRRPSIQEVAGSTGVDAGFLGMVRGINEGVQIAMATQAESEATETSQKKAKMKELQDLENEQAKATARDAAMMIFEDNPRLLNDMPATLAYAKELLGSPPPTDGDLKLIIREAGETCRSYFPIGNKRGRVSKKGEHARDRLNHMKRKMAENFIEDAKAAGVKPTKSSVQEVAQNLFGSHISTAILTTIWDREFPASDLTTVWDREFPSDDEKAVDKEPETETEKKTNTQHILGHAYRLGKAPDSVVAAEVSESIGRPVSELEVRRVREELKMSEWVENETHEPDIIAENPTPAPRSKKKTKKVQVSEPENVETPPPAEKKRVRTHEPKTEGQAPVVVALEDGEDGDDNLIKVEMHHDYHWRQRGGPGIGDEDPECGEGNHPTLDGHAIRSVSGNDAAAEIGNAIATLIRNGCKVSFTVDSPEDPTQTVRLMYPPLGEAQ